MDVREGIPRSKRPRATFGASMKGTRYKALGSKRLPRAFSFERYAIVRR